MITFPFSDASCQRALRPVFEAAAIPAVLVPALVTPADARSLRRQAADGLRTFDVADRGHYARNDTLRCAPLERDLVALAREVTGFSLKAGRPVWLHLRPGDYALRKDDGLRRPPGACVEVTLDLSVRTSIDAQVVYTAGGGGRLVVPQVPLMASVVLRTPDVFRYDHYLPRVRRGAAVWRLRIAFPIA